MSGITISNTTSYDKNPLDFYNNREYKMFGLSDGSSTLVPMYKELIAEVHGENADSEFRDLALTKVQIEKMKQVFEREIRSLLQKRDDSKIDGFARRNIFGKEYFLDLRLNPNDDRTIEDMFLIYSIASDCLKKNKPVFLSID